MSRSSGVSSDIFEAIQCNDLQTVRELLAQSPAIINQQLNYKTPIQLAAALGRWDIVIAIANAVKTDENDTACYDFALLHAAKANKQDAALALVKAGASVNWCEKEKSGFGVHKTPCYLCAVHYAIQHNNMVVLGAILEKHKGVAANWKPEQADANTQEVSLLRMALELDNSEAVRLLLQHGATPTATDDGWADLAAEKRKWDIALVYFYGTGNRTSLANRLLKIAEKQNNKEKTNLLFPICYPEEAKLENFKVSCTWDGIKSLDVLVKEILVDFGQNEFLSAYKPHALIQEFLLLLQKIFLETPLGDSENQVSQVSDVTSKSAILLKLFLQGQTDFLSASTEKDRVIYGMMRDAILNTMEVSVLIPKQRETAGEDLSTADAINAQLSKMESHLNGGGINFSDEKTRDCAKRVLIAVQYVLNNFSQLNALAQKSTGLINLSGPDFSDEGLTTLTGAIFRDTGLPFHLDHQGKDRQLSQALFHIAKAYVSAFLVAEKAGQTKEFFEKSTEGLCLDGKITNVSLWASQYLGSYLSINALMEQYVKEYYAHLEIIEKVDLWASDTVIDINHAVKFIFKHHSGVLYAENKKANRLSPEVVIKYLREVLNLGADGISLAKAREIIAKYKTHHLFFNSRNIPELDALKELCTQKKREHCVFITKKELEAAVDAVSKKRGGVAYRASLFNDSTTHPEDKTGATAVIRELSMAII